MSKDHFVRDKLIDSRALAKDKNIIKKIGNSLFASTFDTIVTIFCFIIIFVLIKNLSQWLIFDAVWNGDNRLACATINQGGIQENGWSGACWPFVINNITSFIYGDYPISEIWRLNLLAVMFVVVILPLLILKAPFKILNAIFAFIFLPIVGYFLVHGGYFGLTIVDMDKLGGLFLTFVIAYMAISFSLPLGSILALMRLSTNKFFSVLATFFIEVIRSFPLIAILFAVIFLLPLLLPGYFDSNKFLRALIAIILFSSVYIAEVIRGGIASIEKGQYEVGKALGMTKLLIYLLIILPQAIRRSLPAIVNTIIGIFKDTSLVYVISMFDFIGIVRRLALLPEWLTPVTPTTGLIFLGIIFWVICFSMSRYSKYLERKFK
ncbi:amino acid ABC transporter permease [Bartonella sp. DGB1]|uniref:amino acid ABC transporter permease n=1 Tax=Bartonella sp. DGB1 TaxID=3239807 RepID=UPI0035241A74